jgi:hypothetical protein
MKQTLLLICGLASTLFGQAQNVGIGTSVPFTKLHVYNGASGTFPFAFSPLAVESNGHTYINILSPAANEGAILFGQPGSSANGVLMYNNISTPNGFQFRNNGNLTRMVITNTGSVGIGVLNPDPGALLDINSTTKGFLPPRMTNAERNAINSGSPATGLLVFCTDCTPAGPYSYNGTAWISMSSSAPTPSYIIGQSAHGGIVFWVDETGQHGLVAATADLDGGTPLPWWTYGAPIWCNKARRDGIYIGQLNTDSIIGRHNVPFAVFAAGQCANYLGGGYGDWYLPSIYELGLLRDQRAIVGGFAVDFYWSSTEGNFDTAKFQLMSNVLQIGNTPKSNLLKVRPIRKF